MASGLSFGSLPAFADLTPDQQAQVMAALQQGQSAPAPVAQTPMGGLLGQVDPQADQQAPRPVAMSEADAQRMERAMASPQDRAALGPVPGSPDALMYDRTGMGSGTNGFTGSADPYGSRMVPLPPGRPGDDALVAQPATTGALPVSGMNPGMPQGQTVASSKAVPGPLPNQHLPATPADRVAEPTGGRPLSGFDPLTGAPTLGSPRPFAASPSAVSPSGAAAATAASVGQGQQPGIMDRFINGLDSPDFGNLLRSLSIGLLTQRGIGPGIGAGLQNYQTSQAGSLKQQLEQIKFMQDQQGQQATYGSLRKAGYSHEQAVAGMYNPTMLSNLLAQQNKAPNTVDKDGFRYLVPPGAANDQNQWQRIGSVNGPQPGFEADPNTPGGQRPITGGSADPAYKGSVAGAEAKAKDEAVEDKPIRGRPGDTFVDPKTLKPVFSVPGNQPEGFQTEDKLRTEFSKQLGTFGQVHDGYGRVIAATRQREANPGSVSPASDIGLIFGYMKMLDPGSVVREGEYATAKNATGVPERVLNAYNKALNGEFLTDAQRKDFLGQAAELYSTARKTADGVADRYRGLATQYGVSPDRSVYLPDMPVPPKIGQQSQTTPDIPQGAPAGTRRAPDGNLYAPDPARPGKYLQVR